MSTFQDLTGLRFYKLTVIREVERPKNSKIGSVLWFCKCDCGNETVVFANNLKLNCRWVTPKQNCRNRRTIKLNEAKVIDIRSSTKTTKQLMAEYDVCKSTINNIKSKVSWN